MASTIGGVAKRFNEERKEMNELKDTKKTPKIIIRDRDLSSMEQSSEHHFVSVQQQQQLLQQQQ